MKKIIKLLPALLISTAVNAQTDQMQNWFISPYRVDMPYSVSSPTVTVNPLGTGSPTAVQVANGMYANGGGATANQLLFYISDGGAYDYNNTFMGPIPNGGTEAVIVPFGDNDLTLHHCKNKYNVFTTSGGVASSVCLYKTVVDMNSYSVSTVIMDVVSTSTAASEFGAIAVSKPNPSNVRYLYFLAGSGYATTNGGIIKKWNVNQDGSVSVPAYPFNPILFPQSSNPISNAGEIIFARELDISPDGKYLAWGSFHPSSAVTPRYHLIELNTDGDFNTSIPYADAYHEFNIAAATSEPTNSGFRGVEFYKNTAPNIYRLFLGAGNNGIYYVELPLSTSPPPTPVSGSDPDYGNSQIELSFNGRMYASSPFTSAILTNVGAFDPAALNPSIILGNPSFTIGTTVPPPKDAPHADYNLGGSFPTSSFYTLPDQIDGENYGNILSAPLPAPLPATKFIIDVNSNQTWDYTTYNPWAVTSSLQDAQVIKEIRIENDKHLTINGMTIKFSPAAKVVIKQGASLTLNGTTFTADYLLEPCFIGYTWQGVEVWGTSNESQFTTGQQGQLTMLGNSKIEYAQRGARNWNGVNLSSTGGIIIAKESSFLNNKVDVELKPYQNFNPLSSKHPHVGNRSYFKECSFTTNSNYPFALSPVHVFIDGCDGIDFTTCAFSNLNTNGPVYYSDKGIRAINGGFTVTNSTFNNLRQGIDAGVNSTNMPFRIYQSTFTDNQTGIVVNGVNNITVQNNNNFYIGGNQNPAATNQTGIRMNSSSGYIVEENQFSVSNSVYAVYTRGVYVFNSGPADNVIYKNKFDGLNYGNNAAFINRDNSNPSFHGLQYLCNENGTTASNSDDDIYISTPGIRLTQYGAGGSPAGNTFSQSLSTININNNTTNTLNYYYTGIPSTQIPNITSGVTLKYLFSTNTCPSHIGGTPEKLTTAQIETLNNSYDSAETAYLNLLYSYNQLMDGGSTNALLNQIQQSWSQDALVLRDELLARSPYLSEEVLREVALGNVLPQVMLLAVCLANPDGTRNEDFLVFLQNEIPNPLPQYMIDMIRASWDVGTARTTMESMLANFSHIMATSSDRLLSDLYFRTDLDNDSIIPTETDTIDYNDSIRYWLNRVQTLTAKYDLIENYFAANELTSAENLLDTIPFLFDMSADQLTAYNDYVYFFNFRKNIFDNGKDLMQLDSTQIQELENFSEAGDDLAKVMAQNTLCFYYAICREDSYDLPSNGNRMVNSLTEKTKPNINTVSVAPNPCKSYTSFNYSLPLLKDKAILTISEITGKIVKSIVLQNNEGQQIWETRELGKGIYFYSVKDANGIIAKGKIAVQK